MALSGGADLGGRLLEILWLNHFRLVYQVDHVDGVMSMVLTKV
jgi:hypothetical protein